MKKYSVEQRGRSMIEMLGVLAIVGVLSVAGIAGYSKAMGKFKVSKAQDQVSNLSSNIKVMFANIGSYDTLKSDKLGGVASTGAFKLDLIPEDMIKGCGGDATKALDGPGTCVSTGINGKAWIVADGGKFHIVFTNVSKESCIAFVNSEWGSSAGFKGLNITKVDDKGEVDTNIENYTVAPAASQDDIFEVITGTCDNAGQGCGSGDCAAVWTFL